jgi:hypothetical protein
MSNLVRLSALAAIALTACFPLGAQPPPPTPPTSANAADALANAKAHPYNGGKLMTAVNNLGTPICRLVILAETGHDDRALIGKQFVNQAGATDPEHGSLDPTDKPLLSVRDESPVFYPNVPDPQPPQMVVTAFGCLRAADGEFYTDERTVLMQKHMAVAVNGKLVLDQ